MATSRGATASDGPEDQDQPPRLRRHAAAAAELRRQGVLACGERKNQSGFRIRFFCQSRL